MTKKTANFSNRHQPLQTSLQPSQIENNKDGYEDMPELADYSDDEDDREEDGDDDFYDDCKVERELMREEREEGEMEKEPPTQTSDLPVVGEPLQRRSAEPTQHNEITDTQPSARSRCNVAPAPGFYKETRTYNCQAQLKSSTKTEVQEAQLAALISELDGSLGQEGVSFGGNPELLVALIHAMAISKGSDDPTFDEAMIGPERAKWFEAIKEEVAQIEKMHTYNVVEANRRDIPNIIGSRFILQRKRDAQGRITRYKARLVGKGYSQRPGINFNEMFAPTIHPVTQRLILSVGATRNSVIKQADAKNTYLNGVLPPNEIIYMHLPPILYELHPDLLHNKWYEELCLTLSKIGLTKSNANHALFYRVTSPTEYCLLRVATDDFTFVADSKGTVKVLKGQMGEYMELVDMGELTWILGVDIQRNYKARTISLSQAAYVNTILERFGMTDAKNTSTPLPPSIDLTPGSKHVSPNLLSPKKKTEYHELIGLLMYLNVMTRPNIAQALSVLARFFKVPHTAVFYVFIQ
ncbi:hypothetical protein EST38_g12268 [Candolleomyces aberdarensis]|uniref:Reverse transcriptase Ty1/copia-type domain-containing protein n=1 Tax=Candolleomyces aberdarensis TaxID=2316362 RepID=A0A4Q2D5Y2_9AGAR|nr:hypothetical protein EST38_g12268 [Candolleomyces aberdarensis]